MRQKKYELDGITWVCSQKADVDNGWWSASNGTSLIRERNWTDLVESIKLADPMNPRVDAVAVPDPLPGMGIRTPEEVSATATEETVTATPSPVDATQVPAKHELLSRDYSNVKLMISTPMYGGNCTATYHRSMLGLQILLASLNITTEVSGDTNDALITRARNNDADRFRASGYTHHLFIDGDIGFRPEDILHLIAADKDLVVAPYARKNINWVQIKRAVEMGVPPQQLAHFACDIVVNSNKPIQMDGAPQEVTEGGTGMMLIKRNVYERMMTAYPESSYFPMKDETSLNFGILYDFFPAGIDPVTRHYLSEDWSFCRRFTRIGGQVWILPWIQTVHVGAYPFIGDMVAASKVHQADEIAGRKVA